MRTLALALLTLLAPPALADEVGDCDRVSDVEDPVYGPVRGAEICLDPSCMQHVDVQRTPDGRNVVILVALQKGKKGDTSLPAGTSTDWSGEDAILSLKTATDTQRIDDPTVGLRWVLRFEPDDALLTQLGELPLAQIEAPLGKRGWKQRLPKGKSRKITAAARCLAP